MKREANPKQYIECLMGFSHILSYFLIKMTLTMKVYYMFMKTNSWVTI